MHHARAYKTTDSFFVSAELKEMTCRPAVRLSDWQLLEVQHFQLIPKRLCSPGGGASVLRGVCGFRARLEIGERLVRRGRAQQTQRRRRLEAGADGTIVYGVRAAPQLFVLLLQFADQLLELQHLQLRAGDAAVAVNVGGRPPGVQHLCLHLGTRTWMDGGAREATAWPCVSVCGGVVLKNEKVSRFTPPPLFKATTHTDSRDGAQPTSDWSAAGELNSHHSSAQEVSVRNGDVEQTYLENWIKNIQDN